MSLKNKLKGLMFKKPHAQMASSDLPKGSIVKNPYLSARRTWNDHVGSIVTVKQAWQFIAIFCLMIALACVGGLIHIGSQSKFIPYIVQVDKLGHQQSYGRADQTSATDLKVMASRVSSFISDARMVTPDVKLQRDAIFRTYAVLGQNDPATQKMNEWLNGSPDSTPFKRAATETVAVEIRSVMQQTPETWQVDWIETTRDRQGVVKGKPAPWRSLVTVYTAETTPATDDQQMWDNPIRLFVRDFTWSKQL